MGEKLTRSINTSKIGTSLELLGLSATVTTNNIYEQVPVAAVPSKYVAGEPETVNRKGLQVTKSLEASPPLKNWRQGV
jgi:hypothetical protein